MLVQNSQFDVAFKEARRIADESGDFGQKAGIGFLRCSSISQMLLCSPGPLVC